MEPGPNDPMFDIPVLVVGDVMLDRHVHGHVRRISPEAPVPVVSLVGEHDTPGGAGNVAATLAGLGCGVTLAGLTGTDAEGAQLREALRAKGVDRLALLQRPDVQTITKTRILSDSQQQLLRLDRDGDRTAFAAAAADLLEDLAPGRRARRGGAGRLREGGRHPGAGPCRHRPMPTSGASPASWTPRRSISPSMPGRRS